MDLRDVLYIIDGSLEVARLPVNGPDGEPIYEAVLFDTTHDPCLLKGKGLKPEPDSGWRYAQARAQARYTPRAAVEALAERIAGTSLGHDWPVMWKSYTEWVRIPPTLTAGDIEDSVPKAPRPADEEPTPEPVVAPA